MTRYGQVDYNFGIQQPPPLIAGFDPMAAGAGTDGKSVQVVINGVYGSAFKIALTAGSYTGYTIPLSALGNPATVTESVIQSAGGNVPSTIYVDDSGFI